VDAGARRRSAVVVAAVLAGLMWPRPRSGEWRVARPLYRSSSAAAAYLTCAVLLWRARSAFDGPGRVLTFALAGFGLSQLHLCVYLTLSLLGVRFPYDLDVFAVLDLFWIVAIVATMAGMALADQRQAASSALRRQEDEFRRMIEHSSDIVAVLTDTHVLRYLSPSATRILGWGTEPLGHSAMDYVHPDDLGAMQALAQRRDVGATPFAFRFRGKDGNWRRLEGVATRVKDAADEELIYVNARDLAERDRLEATLREAQKLESVGRLAAAWPTIQQPAHRHHRHRGSRPRYWPTIRRCVRPRRHHRRLRPRRRPDAALLSFARRQIASPVVFDISAAVARVGRWPRVSCPLRSRCASTWKPDATSHGPIRVSSNRC
jgi:PAS domain S-box-containing protein